MDYTEQTLASEETYKGKILSVHRDRVRLPDGSEAVREVVEHSGGVGVLPLVLGFVAAFLSGFFACKVMIALVRKAKLVWFALYCLLVAVAILIFA